MNKRDFVQHYVLRWFDRCRPQEPRLNTLIYEGERLWTLLEKRGYGTRQERGPRPHMDWYRSLSNQQRDWFDRFWDVFNYKHGKQGAAMRWAQINPDALTARHIISAAEAEAAARSQRKPDQIPIMAQGWLNERRWEDHPEPSAREQQAARDWAQDERARLRAELQHVEQLHQRTSDTGVSAQLAEQVEDLKARIASIEAHD